MDQEIRETVRGWVNELKGVTAEVGVNYRSLGKVIEKMEVFLADGELVEETPK